MNLRICFLASLLASSVFLNHAHAQMGAMPTTEAGLRAMVHIGEDYTVSYKNTDGSVISFDEFIAAMQSGKALRVQSNPDAKQAVFELSDQKPPQSGQVGAQGQPGAGQPGAGERSLPDDEAGWRALAHVDDSYGLGYKNTEGADITFDEFLAGARSGLGFALMRKPDAKQAVLQLRSQSERPVPAALGVQVGDSVPSAYLDALQGAPLQIPSPAEKPILISFFFAECGPCIQEVPALNEARSALSDVQLAAVTFDEKQAAQEFVDKHGLKWPVHHSAQDFIDGVRLRAYPFFMLLSADGRLLGSGLSHEVLGKPDQSPAEHAAALRRWVDALRG